MTLRKIEVRPGVNREATLYAREGVWWDADKIRFRQGTPEKIGGWQKVSNTTYVGYARTMLPFVTLDLRTLLAMGTHLKYYIVVGGTYRDITPIRRTSAAGAVTFQAQAGSSVITVTDALHGARNGDSVIFSGAVSLGGLITAAVLNQEWQITIPNSPTPNLNVYTINPGVVATIADTGNGGAAVVGAYELNTGLGVSGPLRGWGSGWWGQAPWGFDGTPALMRIWTQTTYGEDIVFGYNGGPLYYWSDQPAETYPRGVLLSSMATAEMVPTVQNLILSNESARITMVFGTNDPFGVDTTSLDPLLMRWSDQESITNWNSTLDGSQAGSLRLTLGTAIVSALQTRQEILCWTDTALYSIQYIGPPFVFSSNVLETNISIVGQNAATNAASKTYWMGRGKFYVYDGRVNTLRCDLREYIFDSINEGQYAQIFATTVEAFSEIWWFYPSALSTNIDRYVIYNYQEDHWSFGTLGRTAWVDAGIFPNPIAATYSQNLCYQEFGTDDYEGLDMLPIRAYATSGAFDIEDGDRFGFIWRLLPDVTFRGSASTNTAPKVTISLIPMKDSGSGYNNPLSEGGSDNGDVVSGVSVPIETFTRQVNIRVRGRQLLFSIESNDLGVNWQSGYHRLDIVSDGRRG